MACIVFTLGLVLTVIAGARELQDVNGKVEFFREKSATNDVRTEVAKLSRKIQEINTRVQETNTFVISQVTSLSNQMKEVGNNVSEIAHEVSNLEKKVDMLHPSTVIEELSRKIEEIGGRVLKINTFVISQVTSLSKQVKEVRNNVSEMAHEVSNLEKKIDILHPSTTGKPTTTTFEPSTTGKPTTTTFVPSTTGKSTTTSVRWVYYPPHTTEHRAKKFYPEYNLKFVGFGSAQSESFIDERHVSFEYCLQKCFNNRKENGDSWNDMQYRYREERCFCGKNSGSHLEFDTGDLHYYFQ